MIKKDKLFYYSHNTRTFKEITYFRFKLFLLFLGALLFLIAIIIILSDMIPNYAKNFDYYFELSYFPEIFISLVFILVTIFLIMKMNRISNDYYLDRHKTEIIEQRAAIEDLVKEIKKPDQKNKKQTLTSDIDKKKERYLNISNVSFHFANKDEIKSIYNDYFKEPSIEKIVTEVASELGGEVKGKVPQLFEGSAMGKDLNKLISTMKIPDISVSEMFRRYQRETIKNNQVVLGLELLDVDLTELNDFNSKINILENKYGLIIDNDKLQTHRSYLLEKAAEKTLVRLESATGWLLVEGKYTINDINEQFYQLIYDHPVNEYYSDKTNKITFNILIRKNSIEPSFAGNYAQSIGKSIPLRIYGNVWQPIDRKRDIYEFQITPLAIY